MFYLCQTCLCLYLIALCFFCKPYTTSNISMIMYSTHNNLCISLNLNNLHSLIFDKHPLHKADTISIGIPANMPQIDTVMLAEVVKSHLLTVLSNHFVLAEGFKSCCATGFVNQCVLAEVDKSLCVHFLSHDTIKWSYRLRSPQSYFFNLTSYGS